MTRPTAPTERALWYSGFGVPLLRLREQAWEWCQSASGGAMLRVFVDLTFAFALARFGDTGAARALLDDVGLPDSPATGRRSHRPDPSTGNPRRTSARPRWSRRLHSR